jgi:hypothetical protein
VKVWGDRGDALRAGERDCGLLLANPRRARQQPRGDRAGAIALTLIPLSPEPTTIRSIVP